MNCPKCQAEMTLVDLTPEFKLLCAIFGEEPEKREPEYRCYVCRPKFKTKCICDHPKGFNPELMGYNQRHEAAFCLKCDEWLESGCEGEGCHFCAGRPEKPSLCQQ